MYVARSTRKQATLPTLADQMLCHYFADVWWAHLLTGHSMRKKLFIYWPTLNAYPYSNLPC